MTILLVWALIAGQSSFASHRFGVRATCEATRVELVHYLDAKGAKNILALCVEDPAI